MKKLMIVAALLVSAVVSTAARADQLPKYYIENWCAEAHDGYITSISTMEKVETECEGEQQGMRITQQGYRTGGVFCRFTEVKLTGDAAPTATKMPRSTWIPEVVVTIKCPNEEPVKARMNAAKGSALIIAPLHGVPSLPHSP